jgi:hypothetical protein
MDMRNSFFCFVRYGLGDFRKKKIGAITQELGKFGQTAKIITLYALSIITGDI